MHQKKVELCSPQEIVTTLQTVGDWIRYAATRFNHHVFFGHGYDNAWDEAVQLVLTTLNLSFDTSPQVFHCRLLEMEKNIILARIDQRVSTRVPLAYILEEAWFCGMSFFVDNRVLVPRSPLGELIEKQFFPWIEDPDCVQRILDIGTGSGCIAIAASVAFPQAEVDAVDINESPLAVAAINIDRFHLQDRVKLYQSDCFESLPLQKYDLILSNPPYVSEQELKTLPPEYHHEPREGLYAHEEGLFIVNKIIKESSKYLTENGILVVEVGYSQESFNERFNELPVTWLDLEKGGSGVFLINAKDLLAFNKA